MFAFFIPAVGYAEIHYRFRYFFSLLKKAQPEIVADLPQRVQKSAELPLLIVIKDADRYPIMLKSVTIFADKKELRHEILNKKINAPYYDLILPLKTNELAAGDHLFDVKIEYRCGKRNFICYNDNYRGLSHAPLTCHISARPLPRFAGYIYGDLHAHSNYTADQIEFGASLRATARLARSMGLDFFAATDHSYDLDDMPGDYLQKDANLGKWRAFKSEVQDFNNGRKDFCILPGEEVSVGNARGQNIHLLVFNSSRFWPGSGDSGEKWLRFRPDLELDEILQHLENSALAFAAHPAARTPHLQRLLINRGDWGPADIRCGGLTGLQFINGGTGEEIARGLSAWTTLLLEGRKLFLLGGNDAHGSFSRTRQIKTPFISLREHTNHLFGFWRTGLALEGGTLNIATIIAALKAGNYFVSNGPALRLRVFGAKGELAMGQSGTPADYCRIEIMSNEEFGSIEKARLLAGFFKKGEERPIWQYVRSGEALVLTKKIDINELQAPIYLRAEATTANRRGIFRAYSNPIWIEAQRG